MVKKKTQKTKTWQVIWRWKYTTNHCQGEKYVYTGKKYILEKKKANLVIPIEKIKRHAIVLSKEKTALVYIYTYIYIYIYIYILTRLM